VKGDPRRTGEWARMRLKVIKRDPICVWCGVAKSTDADHLIRVADGGQNTMTNLVGSCNPCNNLRNHTSIVRRTWIDKGWLHA